MRSRTILTISDLHIPFEHPEAFAFIRGLEKAYKPDIIVNLGDEIDGYCFSLFGKSPDAWGTADEIEHMRKHLRRWFKAFPLMKLCYGNHTLRYIKRASDAGIPAQLVRTVSEFLQAPPGWEWRDEWIIDAIRFFHGEPYGGKTAPRNMLQDRKMNQCHGHLHSLGGTTYETSSHGTFWVASSGCLVNSDTYAFTYSKVNRVHNVLGTTVIVDGTPIFEELR